MAITDYSTTSLVGVVTKNQGFLSHEIEDKYNSHLDMNGFCTIDNTLQALPVISEPSMYTAHPALLLMLLKALATLRLSLLLLPRSVTRSSAHRRGSATVTRL